jgi:hypothetical protein
MEDTKGEGARKRLPTRRLNMIDGNISSWCLVLNSPERLELIRQANELAKVLGELEEDCLREKEEKQRKALEEEKKKQECKEEKREKELQEREEALKTLPPLVDWLKLNGPSEIPKFTVPNLCMIICFVFNDEQGKQSKLNKPELINIALERSGQWFEQEAERDTIILPVLHVPIIDDTHNMHDPSAVIGKQLT